MILALAGRLGLLAQTLAVATTAAPKAEPVRVWRTDSTVYVNVRDAGYLTVLQVDPVGRIRVLFPLRPDDPAAVPGGVTFEVGVPVDGDGAIGTIVAAHSRWPFQPAGLRTASSWDYDGALLFQPTAGDPLAALLDIVDRMADGRAYDFDVTRYRPGRTLAPRGCLGCVRSRPAAGVEQQSTVVIDQANTVDCSSAYLVNSFCGVIDNRVTNTYVYNEMSAPAASEPIYVPYYLPIFIPLRTPVAPHSPPAPPHQGRASVMPLRRTSGVVVPPPPPQPRPRLVMHVQQPRQRYSPVDTRNREEMDRGSTPPAAAPPVPQPATRAGLPAAAPAVPRYIKRVSAGMPVRVVMSWEPATTDAPEPVTRASEAREGRATGRGSMSVSAARTPTLVPSDGMLRAMRSRPR